METIKVGDEVEMVIDTYRQCKQLKSVHIFKRRLIGLQGNIRSIRETKKIDKRVKNKYKIEIDFQLRTFRYLIGLEDGFIGYFARCEFDII